jgi:hypothetical protein
MFTGPVATTTDRSKRTLRVRCNEQMHHAVLHGVAPGVKVIVAAPLANASFRRSGACHRHRDGSLRCHSY